MWFHSPHTISNLSAVCLGVYSKHRTKTILLVFAVKTIDTFTHSGQYYAAQELLDCNLRQLYQKTLGRGFSLRVIQKFTSDLLR